MRASSTHSPAFGRALYALALLMGPTAGVAGAQRPGMIVPAYQYPTLGTLWTDCARASSRVPLVAVLNPASGPGQAADPNYVAAVNAVRSAGGRVIGYVHTFQAGIPISSALAQVDRYRAWYALDGIFLDGMANDSDPSHVAWYAALRDSIRAREPSWLVVGCPGANSRPEYLSGADVICIVETDGRSYFDWDPSPWVLQHPPSQFLHLVHTLSTADSMRMVVSRAVSSGAGWVYVTNDLLPNPWDATPVYWDALVDAVQNANVSVETPGAPRMRLRAWPNPARGPIRFESPGGLIAREIEILDGAGRLIARVTPGASRQWDGRDQAGRPVPAGVYFARVRDAAAELLRVTIVR